MPLLYVRTCIHDIHPSVYDDTKGYHEVFSGRGGRGANEAFEYHRIAN
jgi:hypothetical protein